jgi:hypothetical protein
MDPNISGANEQPQSQQPQMAPEPQATVVPIGDAWAPGIYPVPVAGRGRKLRWGIAGAIVLIVVLVTGAGIFVLSGASGSKSLTASVAPKGTVAFLEVRTDLPGDQHAKLADFMSHFPGFKDRAQFDTALDEMLNKLTGAVSPDLTYTSAFKPWMEGEVSIAVTDLGSGSLGMMTGGAMSTPMMFSDATPTGGVSLQVPGTATTPTTSNYTPPGAVAIVALKDKSAAQSWVDSELTKTGAKTTAQDYAGTQLYTFSSGVDAGAYAFSSQDLILGTVDAVKASLDTKTNGSLADDANYQAAMGALSGDSLARFYIDPRAMVKYYMDSYSAMMSSLGGLGAGVAIPTLPISSTDIPAWIVGSIRADSSDMVVNVVMPKASGSGSDNHTSTLASVLPSSTVMVTEMHSIGKLITNELAALDKTMPNDSSLKSVKQGLGLIGGIDWLGDGAVVVTKDGSTYGGGVVVEATDASTATSKVGMVSNLLTLAGASATLTTRDETYKGVDITVITLPSDPVSTVGAEQIAFAAKGNLIVVGLGDTFVKSVIDTTSSNSLASQSDYTTVMAAAGSNNEQSVYVNIPALEDQIGQAVFAVSPSRWTQDYKPYFDHVGGIGYSVIDGNTVILRFIVTAK